MFEALSFLATVGLIGSAACAVAAQSSQDAGTSPASERSMRFTAHDSRSARKWQRDARQKLFELMMGGAVPQRVPLAPEILRRIEPPNAPYVLEEVTIQSLPDRRAHLWVAAPKRLTRRRPAVLAIHGHGGTGQQIVNGEGLYWYGRALAEMGYVVVAPDVGQHDLQHASWSLMGERTWDCIRALDYACTRSDVDDSRMAVCGLSLGGETTMYVAALDERVKVVDSSGWLTTVQNMRTGHCTCYDFPGLGEHFEFSDIFACVAPRPLVFEIGEKERAPGGFPLDIARRAFAEVQRVYRVMGAPNAVSLTAHPGGHVFVGYDFWPILAAKLGTPEPFREAASLSRRLDARAELAGRCFGRAVGVLTGWWQTLDKTYGLFPRTLTDPTWAPNDNAADMLPFLFITDYLTGAGYRDRLDQVLAAEARLTNRDGVLPDWFSLKTGTWTHEKQDLNRMIFCAAEYCKDGLMPMTEIMGRGPWTDRMLGLLDAVIARAPVHTAYGPIPASDAEVNGDMLQVLGRVHSMTGDRRYMDQMLRIADAYCLEVLPTNGGLPAHRWDFESHRPTADVLNLNDHGNEIILGLVEAYISAREHAPERAARWRSAIAAMFRRLLEKCRNADGVWVGSVVASTAAVQNPHSPDTWGYALAGLIAFADAADDPFLLAEAQSMLSALAEPRYTHWSGADAYADSIEGAILVRSRFDSAEIDAWLNRILPIFFGCQRDSGIVEGWYGDGNYARTALMAALYLTEGVHCAPWQDGLRIGAMRSGGGLTIRLQSERDWSGVLRFDTPRHRDTLRLPCDYPRLNKWPEWFTVERDADYSVTGIGTKPQVLKGNVLAAGLRVSLSAGGRLTIRVRQLTHRTGNNTASTASNMSGSS